VCPVAFFETFRDEPVNLITGEHAALVGRVFLPLLRRRLVFRYLVAWMLRRGLRHLLEWSGLRL
jgi:hypothetical protein